MIKNGVLVLKKHNFGKKTFCSLCVISVLFCICIFAFSSCSSTPQGAFVDPVELLDDKSSFYLAIPKSVDSELIERVIQNNITNISESDTKKLVERVDKIYCGLNRRKNTTEIQCTIDANIPVSFIPKLLNKKNGWTTRQTTNENLTRPYTIYTYEELDISFPANNICCLGRDIEKMINNYDYISSTQTDPDRKYYSPDGDDLLSYLKCAESEIRFFANKPQSFLTLLTGSQLDLKLFDVSGSFIVDPKHPNQYLLDIDFNFQNAAYMKAGRMLLTLAFGLTNSQSIVYNESGLKITGIKLDKKQLYKLLVI